MNDIEVSITPYTMTPLSSVTKPFINQLKSFNEYNESQRSNNNSFLNNNNSVSNQRSQSNKAKNNPKVQRSLNEKQGSRMLDDNINDENTLNNDSSPELQSPEDDLKLLEKLFKKV